jgi:repressor LexA
MLTLKQRDLLQFIDLTICETGIAPTFDEMRDALGLASKSGINRLLSGLTERGFVRRIANRSRALEVVRRSFDQEPQPLPKRPINLSSTACLPLLRSGLDAAQYAAGVDVGTVAIPAALIGGGEHFVAIMPDRSMAPRGIIAGDKVLFRRVERLDEDDVGLVALANGQICIRSVTQEGALLRLQAADVSLPTRWVAKEQVTLAGVIAGVVRIYD